MLEHVEARTASGPRADQTSRVGCVGDGCRQGQGPYHEKPLSLLGKGTRHKSHALSRPAARVPVASSVGVEWRGERRRGMRIDLKTDDIGRPVLASWGCESVLDIVRGSWQSSEIPAKLQRARRRSKPARPSICHFLPPASAISWAAGPFGQDPSAFETSRGKAWCGGPATAPS